MRNVVEVDVNYVAEILEFVYQALALGFDRPILRNMDVSEESFMNVLKGSGIYEWHDDLRDYVDGRITKE